MPLFTWILWCGLWRYVLFLHSQSNFDCRQIFFLLHQNISVLLCIGPIVYMWVISCFLLLQIWMFVTQVHVKILEPATTQEQGSLCACVLQFSEESHAKVRAWVREVGIFEHQKPWITYGVFVLVSECNLDSLECPTQLCTPCIWDCSRLRSLHPTLIVFMAP